MNNKENENSPFSEEDIKARILLPYIKSLGFTIEDIKLEKTFCIRLGRRKIRSDKFSKASGRLDILCKKQNDNLFIIEAKAENKKITSNDVNQGISYARLTDPITPFLMVTNGKSTKVFDVVSKEEIHGVDIGSQSEFWSNGCELSTEEELRQRYEALQQFIGYSLENVKQFSYSQIENRMKTIKGSISELHKKYIPDIFLKRNSLDEEFSHFLYSEYKCFALIGESGVGKTNFICALSEDCAKKNISLFFNVSNMADSIIDSIKGDFDWVFSAQLKAPEILRRLQSLSRKAKTIICIFFDAIDESPRIGFDLELDEFLMKLKNFSNIKICVSCKIEDWKRYLMRNGSPTFLSETLYPTISWRNEYRMNLGIDTKYPEERALPGFFIGRFDDNDMKILEKKYRKAFKYDGQLSDDMKNECKLGFMLRVVAEVYEGKRLPEIAENVKLLEEYLFKKLSKLKQPEKAKRYLTEIGRILIEKEFSNKIAKAGKIREFTLRDKLSLSIDQEIPAELFAHNILSKTTSEDGTVLIGFYYSRIRDYVISILSLKLPTLSGQEFSNLMPKLFIGSVGQSAIGWYSKISKREQYEVLMKYKESRALVYLNEYQKIIETNFPKLKVKFEPYSTGKIGIVLLNSQDGNFGFYGLRAIEEDNHRLIEYIEGKTQKELWEKLAENEIFNVKSRGNDFMAIDPQKAASLEIKEQLEKIVENGQLNEDGNTGLAQEKAIAIIYNYGDKLGFSIKRKKDILLRNKDFPSVKCEEIKQKIKFYFAYRYYQYEQIEKLRKKCENSFTRSELDNKEIDRKARKAVKENRSIPRENIFGDFPPFEVLSKAIETLMEHKIKKINLLFPSPDISERVMNARITTKSYHTIIDPSTVLFYGYSDRQLKEFLERFFQLYIKEYSTLIETCFPTLGKLFPFYSNLPVLFYVEASNKKRLALNLLFGYKKSKTKNSIVKVIINPKSSKLLFEKSNYFDIQHWTGLGAIIHSKPIGLDSKLNTYEANKMCILRNWIYRKIIKEIEYLIEGLNK